MRIMLACRHLFVDSLAATARYVPRRVRYCFDIDGLTIDDALTPLSLTSGKAWLISRHIIDYWGASLSPLIFTYYGDLLRFASVLTSEPHALLLHSS